MELQVFKTQRQRLLEAYATAGQEVVAHTIPYHSRGVLRFDVVDDNRTSPPGTALAIAQANQQVTFFNYGVGDQVFLGGTSNTRATESDTNVGEGSSTNGAQDFVIEGIGFSCTGMRAAYAGNDLTNLQALIASTTGRAALVGDAALYDPAALLTPPQMMSPANLENGMFQSLLPLCSVEFLFDRKRVEKIGTIDIFPQAGAASFLRANGEPDSRNRYSIPEGYLWRKKGQPDSEMTATLTLQRPLVVPITDVFDWAGSPAVVTPTTIWLEVTMRLFGLAVELPSAN